MKIKKTFKIYTLGCKVNQYDSADLGHKLTAAGFVLAGRNAQLAIINTCCVTKTAIHKCKRMINRARQENPKAKMAVMGCWPKVYRDEVEKLGADLIWGVGNISKLINQISNFKFQISCEPCMHSKLEIRNWKFGNDKARYFIKIQDGCEQFCSYCIIPHTRGKLRSRGEKEVINEVKQAVKNGYREIVLCGIHLGLYGLEGSRGLKRAERAERGRGQRREEARSDLVDLIKKLMTVEGLGRIRLSSIEATEVSDELIELMTTNKKLCRHLHIPLQSGSDKILKLMNRPYGVKYYKNKIRKIRKAMPDIAITTDVMVGFPGETKEDFDKTYNLIKELKFSRLHVFPFSEHKKTPAAKMPGKVEKEEIERRARKLRLLGEKLAKEYREKFKGRELDVIVECKKGKKYKGKTEYYFDVEFGDTQIAIDGARIVTNNKKDLVGQIVKAKVL